MGNGAVQESLLAAENFMKIARERAADAALHLNDVVAAETAEGAAAEAARARRAAAGAADAAASSMVWAMVARQQTTGNSVEQDVCALRAAERAFEAAFSARNAAHSAHHASASARATKAMH